VIACHAHDPFKDFVQYDCRLDFGSH
jgi:hypothetical protein